MVGNGGKEDNPEWCQFLADDDILWMINDKNSLSGGMIITGITHNGYKMWAQRENSAARAESLRRLE